MKKIINLILMLIVVLVMVIPTDTQASPYPIRYWKRFQKELQDYLINYRAPLGSGNTCLRTALLPDGTSDCLSMGKITKIMSQLDNDDYWAKTDPTKRREYLWSTTRQPYVMKKVVMYFEQNMNLETRIYGATVTEEQANAMVDESLMGYVTMVQDIVGTVLGGYRPGDDDIRALAFDCVNVGDWLTPVYDCIFKAKTSIMGSSLTRIYNAARMGPYLNWKDAKDWTQDEINALYGAVAKDMNAIDDAHKHGIAPVYAKIKQDSMQKALGSLGGVGARTGGMALARGAAVSEFACFRPVTANIGARVVQVDAPAMQRIFQFFRGDTAVDIATGLGPVQESLGQVTRGLDMVARTNRLWIPDADAILAESLQRTYIADWIYFRDTLNLPYTGGVFSRGSGGRTFYNYSNRSDAGATKFFHEPSHQLRWVMSQRKGFNEGLDTLAGLEDYTDWITAKTMQRNGLKVPAYNVETGGYKGRDFLDAIGQEWVKVNGGSIVGAESRLFWIQWDAPYTQLNIDLGRAGFWQSYSSLSANFFDTQMQLMSTMKGTTQYTDLVRRHIQQEQAIMDFIHNK